MSEGHQLSAGQLSDGMQVAVAKNQYLHQSLTRPRDNGVGVTGGTVE